jgi:hypothetical protein
VEKFMSGEFFDFLLDFSFFSYGDYALLTFELGVSLA